MAKRIAIPLVLASLALFAYSGTAAANTTLVQATASQAITSTAMPNR